MTKRRDAFDSFFARTLPAAAALALIAGAAWSHDEDWRKLADRLPPVFGPMQTLATGFSELDTFDADGVILNAWIPLNQFGLNSIAGNDCWGYTSPSGREYAIMGLYNGYGFVEITDPNNPVILNSIPGPSSDWHDIKVVGEYAYGVSEGGGGIQVIDLRNIDNGSVSLVGNISTAGHSTTHNIIVNQDSGALYICGANIGNGGLLRVDLSNPRSPSIVGGWTNMYVHDAQVITPSSGPYAGREIAFCASGFSSGIVSTGLRIVDITNPAAPVTLSTLFYPNAGYSHQAWLSDDGTTLYLNDELDEENGLVSQTTTRVIDVSDYTNPRNVGTFSSGVAAIDHNLYVRDGYIYQANYRSGLRVFDAADKLNPVQVAYFDTFPGSDSADFNGAWSTYPFFDSGTVIISDIERGLFVVTVEAVGDRLRLGLDGSAPTIVSPDGGDPVQIEIIEQGLALDPASVEMIVSQGGGITQVAASALGGGLYGFTFPPLDCDSEASFYFSATATDGSAFTLPTNAPGTQYTATVASDQIAGFADNFQTNKGWSVNSTATDGQWERAIPADASRGAPPSDFDGSGFCYVTDNAVGNSDVDNGFTRLTSPAFDLSGGGIVSYAYWLNDVSNGRLSPNDNLVVEFSGNNGGTWTEVARYASAASAWRTEDLVIDASLAGVQSRVRFTVNDDDPQGVVEAAIDAFITTRLVCEASVNCAADLAPPFGELTFADISAFLVAFTNQDRAADLAAPFGQYTFADISAFLAAFSAGCP